MITDIDQLREVYENMFDSSCVERKFLLHELVVKEAIIVARNDSIANRDRMAGDMGKKVQCLQNQVKDLLAKNDRLQARLPR